MYSGKVTKTVCDYSPSVTGMCSHRPVNYINCDVDKSSVQHRVRQFGQHCNKLLPVDSREAVLSVRTVFAFHKSRFADICTGRESWSSTVEKFAERHRNATLIAIFTVLAEMITHAIDWVERAQSPFARSRHEIEADFQQDFVEVGPYLPINFFLIWILSRRNKCATEYFGK